MSYNIFWFVKNTGPTTALSLLSLSPLRALPLQLIFALENWSTGAVVPAGLPIIL
jgi:hypothetical protein